MIENELQPWLVLLDGGTQVAMWQLEQPAAAALALFSDRTKASAYSERLGNASYELIQPARVKLVRVMMECYQQQLRYAVLDPDGASAHRIFSLRDILKAARIELA